MHKRAQCMHMGHMQNKKQNFAQKQLIKADHELSKTFCFTKLSIVSAEL